MNRALLAAFVAPALWSAPSLASVVIYGGPTYDQATGTGYLYPPLGPDPIAVVGNGTAAYTAQKYIEGMDVGRRALRWDATGASATELETFGAASEAWAMNPAGTVVGRAEKHADGASLGFRAVRWAATGTAVIELSNLGTNKSGFTECLALAVNAAGTAVGFADKYTGDVRHGERAVRWDAGGAAATELGNLGASGTYTRSMAFDINGAGTVVGFANKFLNGLDRGERAVRWDAGSTVAIELGHIGTDSRGFTRCRAKAVNAAGTAVGDADKYINDAYRGSRAVRWNAAGTAVTELANLGTRSDGYTSCSSLSVNAAGTTAGYANKYSGDAFCGYRAVRWDADGVVITELGNFGTSDTGYASNGALAINAAGIAVGTSERYIDGKNLGRRAVAWGLDGAPRDLNMLLSASDAVQWLLVHAYGISDTNWVTGWGTFDPDVDGPLPPYIRAFLLQLPYCDAADFDGSGYITGIDFDQYVFAFEAGAASADIDGDGNVTGMDFDAFVVAFEAGC